VGKSVRQYEAIEHAAGERTNFSLNMSSGWSSTITMNTQFKGYTSILTMDLQTQFSEFRVEFFQFTFDGLHHLRLEYTIIRL
jgi:hypothetical protein